MQIQLEKRTITLLAAALCAVWLAAALSLQVWGDSLASYGMTPVYGFDIEDGEYEIEGDSSSAFFKMRDISLKAEAGEMYATFSIYSLSYMYVYPGTAEQAEKADKADWIERVEDDKKSIFTIPVKALNAEIDCAAYSIARQKWYDRKLLFDASSLPDGAVDFELPDYTLIRRAVRYYVASGKADDPMEKETENTDTLSGKAAEPVNVDRPDGEYSIEVNMTGGSGRASISSPTLLIVRDGKAYAKLLWSSAYYDYMIINGQVYYNLTEDGGNSAFEIPITAMDEDMPVIADTTAMGDPVEIEYSLTFYEDSIGGKGAIPQEAAKKVLAVALVIIIFGGILNYLLKKRAGR